MLCLVYVFWIESLFVVIVILFVLSLLIFLGVFIALWPEGYQNSRLIRYELQGDAGNRLVLWPQRTDDPMELAGTYTCEVSNGYQTVFSSADLYPPGSTTSECSPKECTARC